MPTIEIDPLIAQATSEVLESMCFMGVVGNIPDPLSAVSEWISAELDFSGPLSGKLGVGAPLSTVTTLASAFLGEDPMHVDLAQSSQFLGELSNMICGSLLGQLKDGGVYKLTHPMTAPYFPHSQPTTACLTLQLDDGELQVWLIVEGTHED